MILDASSVLLNLDVDNKVLKEYKNIIINSKFNGKNTGKNTGNEYNKYGYDKNGYDKNGYDKNGYDMYGYSIQSRSWPLSTTNKCGPPSGTDPRGRCGPGRYCINTNCDSRQHIRTNPNSIYRPYDGDGAIDPLYKKV